MHLFTDNTISLLNITFTSNMAVQKNHHHHHHHHLLKSQCLNSWSVTYSKYILIYYEWYNSTTLLVFMIKYKSGLFKLHNTYLNCFLTNGHQKWSPQGPTSIEEEFLRATFWEISQNQAISGSDPLQIGSFRHIL